MSGIAKFVAVSLCLSLCLCWARTAQAQAQAQVRLIGEIKVARDAKIIRAGTEMVASVGTPLAEKDILITGASGAIGFVLDDNSVITLGPLSLFKMSAFVFNPAEQKFGLFGEIFSGTMEYISGKISKIARDAAKFRTPYTTVAARGTRMLLRGDE